MTAPARSALSFLRALSARAPTGSRVCLVLGDAGVRAAPREAWFLPTPPSLRDVEAALREGRGGHVFVCPHALRPDARDRRERSVAGFTALVLDLDDAESYGRAVENLWTWGLPPSIVVESGGGGAHVYLLLRAVAAVPFAKPVARRLGRAVRSDAVHDGARLLRLPGSQNAKYDPPRPVRLVELHAQRLYALAAVERALDRAGVELGTPEGASEKPERHRTSPGRPGASRNGRGATGVARAPLPENLPDSVRAMIGGDLGCYPSRSERDQAVALALARRGLDDETIFAVFRAHPCGDKAAECADPDNYLARTVAHARDFAAPTTHARVAATGWTHRERLGIVLRLLDGSHAGRLIDEGVSVRPGPRWEAAWAALGVPEAPSPEDRVAVERAVARIAAGTIVSVELVADPMRREGVRVGRWAGTGRG